MVSVTAMAALRSYLLGQIDENLLDARTEVLRRVTNPDSQFYSSAASISLSDFFVEVRGANGQVDEQAQALLESNYDNVPNLSAQTAVDRANSGPFSVGSGSDADYRYRVVVVQPSTGSEMLVLASPVEGVSRTIDRLFGIDTITVALTLALLLMTAYWIIRRELHPLQEMTQTAGAIADGDLSRRVEFTDDHSEVGQLGKAFNAMLSQIEMSFAERQASEDRLRRFAADASHELRTPLTAIRGYAELHRQGAIIDPEHLKRVMTRIEGEAARMGMMVEDLLMLARLDQGRPLDLSRLEINQLVRNVVSDFHAIAPAREITEESDAGEIFVDGDSSRLHQVITNLLSNAITHTPDEAKICVTTHLLPETNEVEIAVADTGQGMDSDSASKVFERFYRIDEGRARSAGGTGLGLAIVQSMVKAHGGSVSLETAPGEGSTFKVRLPRAADDL